MKFLVENFSDQTSTQSLYLYDIINSYNEHTSVLYNGKESVYDTLDKNNPDYFITDIKSLTRDFISYNNDVNQNIKLLLNVSKLSNADIVELDKNLKLDNVNCPLLFSNINERKLPNLRNRRIITLGEAADRKIELIKTSIKYKVSRAYFILDHFTHDDKNPHHIITNNVNLRKDADICLQETHLASLYSNYDEIIFCGIKNYIPQSFFDCLILGCKAYYIANDEDTNVLINTILKPEKSLNYFDNNRMENFDNLLAYIKEKHCGENRVKKLLSQLPRE